MSVSILINLGVWVQSTNSLRKRYTQLCSNLAEFESRLRVSRMKLQDFDIAIESIGRWTTKTERILQEITFESNDVFMLHNQISRLRVSVSIINCKMFRNVSESIHM